MSPNRSFRIHTVLLLLIFLFLFALAACEKGNKGYTFRGTLNGVDTGQLYLSYDTLTSPAYVYTAFDTAEMKGGTFEFTGIVPNPMPCILTRPDGSIVAMFMLENSVLTLDTGTNQFGRIVYGSKSQTELDELTSLPVIISEDRYTLDSLLSLPNISVKRKDSLENESRKVDSISAAGYNQSVFEYIKSHSSSYAVLYGWQMGELWEEGSPVVAKRIFEQFDPSLRSSTRGKYLASQIAYYESLQAGQPAPELNLSDKDGNLITLQAYRGKRIILVIRPPGDLLKEDYEVLSKLKNTVIIVNSPNETWSNLKYINVVAEEGNESPYPISEMTPGAYVITKTESFWQRVTILGRGLTNNSKLVDAFGRPFNKHCTLFL